MSNSNPTSFSTLRIIGPLFCLNFFMADLVGGIGPFLGIFLLAHGWKSGLIGTVMTIGGVAGMLMTIPAGALVDATAYKRLYVVAASVFTGAASLIVIFTQNFWLVSLSQVATAIGGALIGTAVIGITLGIARQNGFNKQNGYNQAFNHAGNVAGAALSGYLGMKFGITAIFLLSALFAFLTIISALLIPSKAIDNNIARGLKEDSAEGDKASGIKVLLQCKPLSLLAIALAFFHLGNGAMLPLYGLAGAAKNQGNPSVFVAMTIVIAQITMVITALIAMRLSQNKGYWLVILISFIALPIRGFIASHFINQVGIYPVQILDGVGAGLQSVAVPGLVAHILNGTGRVNIGQGSVMTMQGIGAALSPIIGGWMAQQLGYSSAFIILGCFALISIALWLAFAASIKAVCAGPENPASLS